MSGLAKRSFTLSGHRTSVALEPAFWLALEQLVSCQGGSLAGLVSRADQNRDAAIGLASVLRVLALTRCTAGTAPGADPLPLQQSTDP